MEDTTIAYKILGKTGILVHSAKETDALEWTNFINTIREEILGKKLKGLIVYSAGGSPRDNQRELLTNLTRFHSIPTAVIVLDNVLFIDAGGCVVSGLNWTGNINEKTWSPSELESAVNSINGKDGEAVLAALKEIHTDLGNLAA